jgi:hypothetical protein
MSYPLEYGDSPDTVAYNALNPIQSEQTRAKRTARRWARTNGHTLDRWHVEAGRPVAVCACGAYVFVERESRHYVYGTGKLPVPGSVRASDPCPR